MTRSQKRLRTAVTAATLALLGLAYGTSFVAAQVGAPRARVIAVSAQRFEYSPAHLTLKKGVPVELQLTSRDVLMGLNIPELNVRGDMEVGKLTRVRFTPQKTGTFVFLCDVFCGTGHERMQGTVTVVD